MFFHLRSVRMILREIHLFKYYMPLLDIKNFNVLLYNKPFFDQPIKYKQEKLCVYKTSRNVKKNYYYTTGNLLNYLYHQSYYKLIDIDLS